MHALIHGKCLTAIIIIIVEQSVVPSFFEREIYKRSSSGRVVAHISFKTINFKTKEISKKNI